MRVDVGMLDTEFDCRSPVSRKDGDEADMIGRSQALVLIGWAVHDYTTALPDEKIRDFRYSRSYLDTAKLS